MSSSNQRWRRIGRGSGPANVLDGRWWVESPGPDQPHAGKWLVIDRQPGKPDRIVSVCWRMGDARILAAIHAEGGDA